MPLRAHLLQHAAFQASAFVVLDGGSLFSEDDAFSVELDALNFLADGLLRPDEVQVCPSSTISRSVTKPR